VRATYPAELYLPAADAAVGAPEPADAAIPDA
jgi:hypothetical protein